MEKSTKSLKISELINELEQLQKQEGDLEVVLSQDPEGNGFGTINPQYSYGREGNLLIIYPVEQFQLD